MGTPQLPFQILTELEMDIRVTCFLYNTLQLKFYESFKRPKTNFIIFSQFCSIPLPMSTNCFCLTQNKDPAYYYKERRYQYLAKFEDDFILIHSKEMFWLLCWLDQLKLYQLCSSHAYTDIEVKNFSTSSFWISFMWYPTCLRRTIFMSYFSSIWM